MKTFNSEEVAEYYDLTEVHYKRGWDLNKSLALHYGYWRPDTKKFRESLANMNEELARFGKIKSTDYVLEAGCGIGGTAIFLASKYGCRVTGISLNEKQLENATKIAENRGLSHLLNFEKQNYTNTSFPDETFDVVWGLESICHTPVKADFMKEAYRILKKGGRLVIGDYFIPREDLKKKEMHLLWKWLHAWAVPGIDGLKYFKNTLATEGFQNIDSQDITENIRRSSWRMFYGSWFLAVLSGGYRILHPNVSRFADGHYKGLFYQYIALKKGLWCYNFVTAFK